MCAAIGTLYALVASQEKRRGVADCDGSYDEVGFLLIYGGERGSAGFYEDVSRVSVVCS